MHKLLTTTVASESRPNATLSGLLTQIAKSKLDGVMLPPYSSLISTIGPSDHRTPLSQRYAYVQHFELTLIT